VFADARGNARSAGAPRRTTPERGGLAACQQRKKRLTTLYDRPHVRQPTQGMATVVHIRASVLAPEWEPVAYQQHCSATLEIARSNVSQLQKTWLRWESTDVVPASVPAEDWLLVSSAGRI
jgi:hypothetical protein